jgi:uridine monophosphate synthetase
MNFFEKLSAAVVFNRSLLCVGLDPQIDNLPDGVDIEERLVSWGKQVIDKTADQVCCYKPNFAFYEQFGLAGMRALQRIITSMPKNIPVLLDVKRGDIGSTAQAYAAAAFEQWGADAVTLSPFLGEDSINPFLAYKEKAVFLLCFTSNPSANQVQMHGDPPLFELIAHNSQVWGSPQQIGLVVGATQLDALSRVREICPQNWILAPGVGAQGGDLEKTLQAGLRTDGGGLIIPVSRAVMQAADAHQAALEFKERINQTIHSLNEAPKAIMTMNTKLVMELFRSGCIKFGNFTLASGKQSPIYIDLRRVVSFPDLFKMVANAYADVVKTLEFDHIASVPYAALPTGAVVAMKLNRSLIYPRKEVKQHGTGQAVEGAFQTGQTTILLEDVITSGGSIVTAAESLRQAGLQVKDVVVLVDREQGGHNKMNEAGIALHAIMTIHDVLNILNEHALIDPQTYKSVCQYIDDESKG